MVQFRIELTEEEHKRLKAAAAVDGQSLRWYLYDLIKDGAWSRVKGQARTVGEGTMTERRLLQDWFPSLSGDDQQL